MKIFQRHNTIDVDLGNLSMEEIFNLPEKKDAGMEEFYLEKVISPNCVQVDIKSRNSFNRGVHTFEYDETKSEIRISSKFAWSAFLIFTMMLLPFLPILLGSGEEVDKSYIILLELLAFNFCISILIRTIRSQSKEIEREMILRVNYLRANKS